MNYNIMVDLDNTMVNFTQMFFNYIKDKFGYKFEENELNTYDFSVLFKSYGLNDVIIKNFFTLTYNDKNFYKDYYIFTNEYKKIIEILNFYKKQNYEIELHTKCSTDVMVDSKFNFIKDILCKDFQFDIITLELVEGKKIISSTKNTHYDLIIDDSPSIVEYYLDNNDKGKVLLPLRKYNEYLLEKYKNRIEIIS